MMAGRELPKTFPDPEMAARVGTAIFGGVENVEAVAVVILAKDREAQKTTIYHMRPGVAKRLRAALELAIQEVTGN